MWSDCLLDFGTDFLVGNSTNLKASILTLYLALQ